MERRLIQHQETPVQLAPGYLLAPFGWAAQPLLAMVCAKPALMAHVLQLDRTRMHLIAFVLAHSEHDSGGCFLPSCGDEFLLRRPVTEVLDAVLGRRLAGIKRALSRLPAKVLPKEDYKRLAELLQDNNTARFIHHMDCLTHEYLNLHDVPAPLRRIVALAIQAWGYGLDGFTDGLRLLAARGAAPTLDALVAEFSTIRHPKELIARIRNHVYALPLPAQMPPARVLHARRIDDPSELRRLAKEWKNCLAQCVDKVNNGTLAIYLWPDADAPALCGVERCGRLGWVLQQAKGPKNADLPVSRYDEIRTAFADAGIPYISAVRLIQLIADPNFEDLRVVERRIRHADRP